MFIARGRQALGSWGGVKLPPPSSLFVSTHTGCLEAGDVADGAEVWAMLLSPGGLFCSLTRLTAFEGPGPVPKVPGMGPWSKGDGRLTAATGRAVDDRVGGAVGSCGSWYPCLTRFWRAAMGPPWLPGPWHTPLPPRAALLGIGCRRPPVPGPGPPPEPWTTLGVCTCTMLPLCPGWS